MFFNFSEILPTSLPSLVLFFSFNKQQTKEKKQKQWKKKPPQETQPPQIKSINKRPMRQKGQNKAK